MHGELDDNALFHHTIRLAKALIEANKDFDLMVMPNADHFMMVNRAYFIRRRYDYFVEHLMGVDARRERLVCHHEQPGQTARRGPLARAPAPRLELRTRHAITGDDSDDLTVDVDAIDLRLDEARRTKGWTHGLRAMPQLETTRACLE